MIDYYKTDNKTYRLETYHLPNTAIHYLPAGKNFVKLHITNKSFRIIEVCDSLPPQSKKIDLIGSFETFWAMQEAFDEFNVGYNMFKDVVELETGCGR